MPRNDNGTSITNTTAAASLSTIPTPRVKPFFFSSTNPTNVSFNYAKMFEIPIPFNVPHPVVPFDTNRPSDCHLILTDRDVKNSTDTQNRRSIPDYRQMDSLETQNPVPDLFGHTDHGFVQQENLGATWNDLRSLSRLERMSPNTTASESENKNISKTKMFENLASVSREVNWIDTDERRNSRGLNLQTTVKNPGQVV